jgi:Rrf2 family protein
VEQAPAGPSNGVRTLLRREESYAVHVIVYLAENPGASNARIAEDLQFPPAFLAKVLARLAKAGYVESRPGRAGGVRLVVDPAEVSLLDVMETVSGPVLMDTCQTRQRCATQQRKGYCNVNGMWMRTTLLVQEAFSGVKMADLVDPPALERLRAELAASRKGSAPDGEGARA